MKKILVYISIMAFFYPAEAQFFKNLKDKVKEASKQKLEEKIIEKVTAKEGKTIDKRMLIKGLLLLKQTALLFQSAPTANLILYPVKRYWGMMILLQPVWVISL
jgi:hypothetical protein